MSDNVDFTPGSGATLATDDVSGVHYPLSKITIGALDANDGPVSATNPMPIKERRANTWAVGAAVNVLSSATSIKAESLTRLKLMIYNASSETVYLGGTSGVTTANGMPLAPGQWWIDTQFTGQVYGIATTGPASVRVSELTP